MQYWPGTYSCSDYDLLTEKDDSSERDIKFREIFLGLRFVLVWKRFKHVHRKGKLKEVQDPENAWTSW